jgi:hypothetical protein
MQHSGRKKKPAGATSALTLAQKKILLGFVILYTLMLVQLHQVPSTNLQHFDYDERTQNDDGWKDAPSSIPRVDPPLRSRNRPPLKVVKVRANSRIMNPVAYDSSPIMIEPFQLVFFTTPKVGCTVWKQLFRRIMGNKDWQDNTSAHNPRRNGLRYLSHCNRTQAEKIMNSPAYTRVIFVRDPKERFLSAFVEKGLYMNGSYVRRHCCGNDDDCWKESQRTFQGFFELTETCQDSHWEPQWRQMEARFWDTIDFVGHLETAERDARDILERIGAWEDYGKTGWGRHGNASIFATSHGFHHTTGAARRLAQYYTPELEAKVEERYAGDYNLAKLGLIRKSIEYNTSQEA